MSDAAVQMNRSIDSFCRGGAARDRDGAAAGLLSLEAEPAPGRIPAGLDHAVELLRTVQCFACDAALKAMEAAQSAEAAEVHGADIAEADSRIRSDSAHHSRSRARDGGGGGGGGGGGAKPAAVQFAPLLAAGGGAARFDDDAPHSQLRCALILFLFHSFVSSTQILPILFSSSVFGVVDVSSRWIEVAWECEEAEAASRSGYTQRRPSTLWGVGAQRSSSAALRQSLVPFDERDYGEFLLCTVTFHANVAHSLTRSP